MTDLVFLGPPGAGKGTQARKVAAELGIPHVSTGDCLREALRRGSPVGLEAKGYMDRGQLVPDAVVDRIVAEKVDSPELGRGFLLDGYPRNVSQAEALDHVEAGRGRRLTAVVLLEVPDDVIERRLTGRRSCPRDGSLYHVEARPPRVEGRCDQCRGELVVRDDDRPDVVQDRLRVYHRETEPIIDHYRKQELVRPVDGTRGIDEITSDVLRALGRG